MSNCIKLLSKIQRQDTLDITCMIIQNSPLNEEKGILCGQRSPKPDQIVSEEFMLLYVLRDPMNE